jgi:MFS family permease
MPETRFSRDSLTILAIGFLVLLVGGGSRFAIGLALKPMVQELDWTRSVLGATAAVFLIVSSMFMFVSGRLADRYSLRMVLGCGLAMASAGLGLMYFVYLPWQIFLFYGILFAIGNGMASIAPVGVLVSRTFPGRMGLANAIAVSGTGIGQLLIIGALTVALASIGWRSAFTVLALVNLALIPIVLFVMSRLRSDAPLSVEKHAGKNSRTLKEALRTRNLWVLISLYALCGFQDFFVATHLVAFAHDRGVESMAAGGLLALMGLAGVIGVVFVGILNDRVGPRRPTIICFVLRTALFGLILIDDSAASIVLFAMLYGLTFWMTAPLAVVFASNMFGIAHLGAISGLINMLHHMSGGLGAYVGAVTFDLSGSYNAVFALLLLMSIAALLLSFALPHDRKLVQIDHSGHTLE